MSPLKKLTKPDVSVDLKDSDFAKLDLKDKEFHPTQYLFLVEPPLHMQV